ncbi:lipopolysaccharide biosynthesis protein [Loktanella sp. DJP18]|uniref:lipopolysaccharide biosynthesis protein n=1 Tax=Loktanella sp. DJP18 TaxID=3409788 RepID=UPI003BB68585
MSKMPLWTGLVPDQEPDPKSVRSAKTRSVVLAKSGSLIQGSSSLLLRFIQLGLSFVVLGLQARFLGLADLGIVMMIVNSALIATPLFEMGATQLMLRGDADRRSLRKSAMTWIVCLTATALAGVFIASVFTDPEPNQLSTWILGVAIAPFSALALLFGAEIRKNGRPLAGLFLIGALPQIVTVVVLAALHFSQFQAHGATADAIILACVAAAASGWVFAAVVAWQFSRNPALPATGTQETIPFGQSMTQQIRAGAGYMLTTLIGLVTINVGFYLVAWIYGSDDGALYRVAMQCAALVTFGAQALNGVFAHRFGVLHNEGQTLYLQNLVSKITIGSSLFAIITTLTFALIGKSLLSISFGEQVSDAYMTALILCLSHITTFMIGNPSQVLSLCGHQYTAMRAVLTGLIILILTGSILTHLIGAEGMAAAMVILSVCNAWTLHRKTSTLLKIKADIFNAWCYRGR